jgi:hypothetical protein
MRVMGIEAIYPKRRTTWPGAGHKIYPYLLSTVRLRFSVFVSSEAMFLSYVAE